MDYFLFFISGALISYAVTEYSCKTRYQSLLELCSRVGAPEKFHNGKFYYIVPEDQHHE